MKKKTILSVMAVLCFKKRKAEGLKLKAEGEKNNKIKAEGEKNKEQGIKLKAIILTATLLFLIHVDIAAQEVTTNPLVKPLAVGDKVPESFWNRTYSLFKDGKSKKQDLSAYKDKLLILDFWATWCSTCYHKLPFLDSVAKVKNKHFAVVMVNSRNTRDDLEKIKTRLNDFAADKPFGIATIYDDDWLTKLFPHQMLPQYVWINQLGIVVAITGSDFINETSINNSIARFNK